MITRLIARLAAAVALVAAAVAGDGGIGLAGDQGQDFPAARDYVDILGVPAAAPAPAPGPGASTGSWVSPCGRNENGHHNTDNMITLPGQPGAAHHTHDYVGNLATNATTTDLDLALAGTTCSNGDTSTYFWPVVRLLTQSGGARANDAAAHDAAAHGAAAHDAAAHGAAAHGAAAHGAAAHGAAADDGQGAAGHGAAPMLPDSVLVEFRGNPQSKVVPMPRFLRAITGDAKAVSKPAPGASAAQWACSGVPERRTPRYPLCPPGQRVLRIFDFPSCWDGLRIDSPNHRAHLVFPTANGTCPGTTFPVPQLRIELAYAVPPGRSFAIDAFPDQHRSPLSDHADFIDVMPESLMAVVVDCLNRGRHC